MSKLGKLNFNHQGHPLKNDPQIKVAIIGCGQMARSHVKRILSQFDNTCIPVVCEPSPEAYAETSELFRSNNRTPPANEPHLERLLDRSSDQLDAAFIITPHVFHHRQAKMCLEAGLDVLLEKPMVMNVEEAADLIQTRDRTGGLLTVAFQGSLSPQIRKAKEMIRSGKMGHIRNISGVTWQNWGGSQKGKWRQEPGISGGGFLFDTGAHILNTIADLAGEDFADVIALFENQHASVEISAVIIGRLKSGVLVTINGCGDTVVSCNSDIRVFCTEGILRTGSWGERLDVLWKQPSAPYLPGQNRDSGWETVPVPPSGGVWEEFIGTREGLIFNPSPPELGLRMAKLWDAIKESASNNGDLVRIGQ